MVTAERIYMTVTMSRSIGIARKRERVRRASDYAEVLRSMARRHARGRGNVLVYGSVRLSYRPPLERLSDCTTIEVRWQEWIMVAPADRAAVADLDPSGLGDVVFAEPLGTGWQLSVPTADRA